jgi:hypothetical protein
MVRDEFGDCVITKRKMNEVCFGELQDLKWWRTSSCYVFFNGVYRNNLVMMKVPRDDLDAASFQKSVINLTKRKMD